MMKRFAIRVSNMVKLLNERGFAGLCDRVLRWAWQTYPYVIICKSLSAATEGCQTAKVQFRTATEEDVPWICRNMSHQGEKAEKLARQYLHGDDITVIGALDENPKKLAFLVTATPKDFGMSLLGDVVSSGDAGIGRAWVPPELRSSGIGAQGMRYAEYVAYQKGVRHLWAFILKDNTPSRRMVKKTGYGEVGSLYLLTRFGRKYAKIKRSKDKNWWYVRVPADASL